MYIRASDVGGVIDEVNSLQRVTCSPMKLRCYWDQPIGCTYERLFVAETKGPLRIPLSLIGGV